MTDTENSKKNDPFLWRSQGGAMSIGNDPNDAASAMIVIGGDLLIVLRKNIYSLILADSTDPERTNPRIPNSQQRILSYGSDEPFVCRTLLQADELFAENTLPPNIDRTEVIKIVLELLKDLASLHESTVAYLEKEKTATASFEGKAAADGTLHLPSIGIIEQTVKPFLQIADHAVGKFMQIAQVFYPDIPKEKWIVGLLRKLETQLGKDDPATKFISAASDWVWRLRNLRNAVEHPKEGDRIEVQNYKLRPTGDIEPPTICYDHKETPLPRIPLAEFMANTVEELQLFFEVFIAHLCNIHVQPFANMERSVVEISEADREAQKKYLRYKYAIAWKDISDDQKIVT